MRLLAAKAGRSAEPEARAMLATVCLSDENARSLSELQSWVEQHYRGKEPRGVVDALIEERRREEKRG